MKNRLSLVIVPALAFLVAGAASAQSSSSPSGTPKPVQPTSQPGSESQPSGVARVAEAPRIIALNFYADWCPGCKALKPKLDEAMKDVTSKPLLSVKLDQTDKESKQAEFMLSVLGLGDLWKEHAGKTGYVLLVDATTKKVVGTIKYTQEVKDIKTTLAAALK